MDYIDLFSHQIFIKHLHITGTVIVNRDNKTKNLPSRSLQFARRDRQQINK